MGIVSEMVEEAMDEAGDADEIENNVSFLLGATGIIIFVGC